MNAALILSPGWCGAILVMLGGALASLAEAQTSAPPPHGAGSQTLAQARAVAPWWTEIDTGPFIADTFQFEREGRVAALKGLAIRLGAAREITAIFDTELLAWRAGFEGAVVLEGTAWNGNHAGNSHIPAGDSRLYFINADGVGIGVDGWWKDPREPQSGPLPATIGRYRGLYRHGQDVVLHYTVGGVKVLEWPAFEKLGTASAFVRTLNIDATPEVDLEFLVRTGDVKDSRMKPGAAAYLVGAPAGVVLKTGADGRMTVRVAKGSGATRFKIVYADGVLSLDTQQSISGARDLGPLTRGGPGLFPQTFAVRGQLDPAAAKKTYAVDVIPLPADNPWRSPPRFGGFDFLAGGRQLAASTWNGDVWIADGVDGDLGTITWRRFASGMFQTLGLKVVDGVIYTQGRDQITRLHDLNEDGEADHYECFNNDVRITTGFHEFTFDLDTDRAGNFYFSKGMPVNPGGRGFMPSTPHNGTVMKVSADGAKLDVVAWGLRAPGGVGVSPEGVVTTGENEGSWVPQCKITWTPPGKVTFNGVVPGNWVNRSTWDGPLPGAPTDYDRPLCWLPYHADNSSGSQAWVPMPTAWDPRHAGEMLHLSYGKSSVFRVLREQVNGVVQGGVYRLPIDVSAAVMRARFHPANGQLYVVGFRGWQTHGRDALQRVRYTGVTVAQPVGLHAHRNGVLIRFSAPLDEAVARDPARYSVSKWNYVWGPQYGSGRFSIDQRDAQAENQALTVPSKGAHNNIDAVAVGAVKVLEYGRAVFLYLPKMTAAMQLELKLDVADATGTSIRETVYSTVHEMAPEYTIPGLRWEDVRVAEAAPVGEPGLVMSFNAETTDNVRVDQLALTVPAGASPSVFVTGTRSFGAAWQGSLVVPERDEYTFTLEGRGSATLRIDGRVIVSGELPLTATAPIALNKGPHAIFCSYRSPRDGEPRVRLLWSSPQFRPEPVPSTAFRHIPGAELEQWSKVRDGRRVFLAAACVACHVPRDGIPADATPEWHAGHPDMAEAGARYTREWLERWIATPEGRCPTVAADRAADVAAYLATLGAGSPAPVRLLRTDGATIAAGAELAEKLQLGPWLTPLMQAHAHTDEGLVRLLQTPARHHPHTVFPDLHLSREEALQLAAYVRARQPSGSASASRGDVELGRQAFVAACVACHGAVEPGQTAPPAPSFETVVRADWAVRGCVAEQRGVAPDLRLPAAEKALLIAFRNADRDVGLHSLRRFAPAEYAASQVQALRCAECHSGKSKAPEIRHAGEKLNAEWLRTLLEGRHPTKTRAWLEARMPGFASRAKPLAVGLAARHGVSLAPEPAAAPAAERVAMGERLIGTEGYSCVACHDAGSRKALQVFEGQGPNLQGAPSRLRYDYYQRWMHWPQRIDPTTIMPRYTKDRDHAVNETLLGGEAARQFEAVWDWMRALPDSQKSQ